MVREEKAAFEAFKRVKEMKMSGECRGGVEFQNYHRRRGEGEGGGGENVHVESVSQPDAIKLVRAESALILREPTVCRAHFCHQ